MLFFHFLFVFNATDPNIVSKMNLIMYPILFIYFFKDSFEGRSIGKRVMKIAVRENGEIDITPKVWQLFLRNVTLLIWPVEVFFNFEE